jgi:predicted MFS family arabinose efflux permease
MMYVVRMFLDLNGLLVTWPLYTMANVIHSTLMLSLYSSTFPSEDVGIAMGIEGSVHSLARVFGPTCGGLVMDAFGYNGLMLFCFILGLMGLFLVFFIRSDEKGPIDEIPKSD